jgi:type IV pilus assembly protein PilA
MKKEYQGFSILELVIIVAVIGVIATLAIPLYQDYQTRSKVSEAILLLGGLKNPMVETYTLKGIWPTVEMVSGKASGLYTSVIVSGGEAFMTPIGLSHTYVEATMKGPGVLEGKKLRMAYIPATRDWVCINENFENPIPNIYLPVNCRSFEEEF